MINPERLAAGRLDRRRPKVVSIRIRIRRLIRLRRRSLFIHVCGEVSLTEDVLAPLSGGCVAV